MRIVIALASASLIALTFTACDSSSDDAAPCEGAACDEGGPSNFDTTDGLVDPSDDLGDPDAPDDVDPEVDLPDDPIDDDPIDDEVPVDEPPVTEDGLTVAELAKIDTLRLQIEAGLEGGREHYTERVSLTFQTYDVAVDYESQLEDLAVGLHEEPSDCPYEDALDNGFEPTGLACQYLIDLALVDAYAELTKVTDDIEIDGELTAEEIEELEFWGEQGAISGIEDQAVRVRTDVSQRGLCNQTPTPIENTHTQGVLVGRQLFAERFNSWLSDNGHVADYPEMSQKITVCNADMTMLAPARKQALDHVDDHVEDHPLCGEDYEPPTTLNAHLHYADANLQYRAGLEHGIDDEHSLAAVRVFHVVPCNVSDPLVVDLDGDGLELLPIYRGVNFDFWASERPMAVAWVAPDDGLLVLDRDADGRITNGAELFGNIEGDLATGFEELAELDTPLRGGNADGVLDARDDAFARLQIWQDRDTDGVSTPDELRTLAEVGITALPLDAAEVDLRVAGQPVTEVTYAPTTSGTPVLVGDAWFRTAPHASRLAR